MTIRSPSAPDGLRISAAKEASAVADRVAQDAMLDDRIGSPVAADPLPVYTVSLDALASDPAALERAELRGWRVLTHDGTSARLVDFSRSDTSPRASAIHPAEAARLLVRAGMLAADLETVDATFEPRILEIGRLGFRALWLHSETAPDHFYTLEEEPRDLSGHDIAAILGPRSRNRLARIKPSQVGSELGG